MTREEQDLEKLEQQEFDKTIKQQAKIKKEFAHLSNCDIHEFQSKFILAQAKELCKMLYRMKFTPFKSLNTMLLEMLEDPKKDVMHQLYITTNEFGEYVPDIDRISKLVLTDADPEEFPERRKNG